MRANSPLDRGPRLAGRAVMQQDWRDVTYLHWRAHPDEVAKLLPASLRVDTFDGSAWVGLIPFEMQNIGVGPLRIPYWGTFPETNVRTYVTGPHGPGVWFHSLDASRLLPVTIARLTYRLPYMWSSMRVRRTDVGVTYQARRRLPAAVRARSTVRAEVGSFVTDPTALDRFLTARWGLYTLVGRRLAYAPVAHEPWPLHQATIAALADEFVAAAGYSVRGLPEHVRYSPGVSVRVGRPRFMRD